MRFWHTLFCALLMIGTATQASAALIINVSQSGNNVIATATGSLNLTGLTAGTSNAAAGVNPSLGSLLLGNLAPTFVYIVSGPTSLGSGGFRAPTSSSGILVGVSALTASQPPRVWIDRSYTFSSPINSTAQWNNQTIASLGLTSGQYLYTWSADSLTINVGEIPEPSSIGLMALGSLAILYRLRKRS